MKNLFLCLLVLVLCGFGNAIADGTLPAYLYTGSDPVEAAAAAWTAEIGQSRFLVEEGTVSIPAPVILRTEEQDEKHLLVYGDFWVFNYNLDGKTLECIAGGETPGIMALEKSGDGWTVTTVEEADCGEDFVADIRRFSHGDAALEELYFSASDGDGDLLKNTRHRFIQDYVSANGLDVEAYHDFGWEPVPLSATPGI